MGFEELYNIVLDPDIKHGFSSLKTLVLEKVCIVEQLSVQKFKDFVSNSKLSTLGIKDCPMAQNAMKDELGPLFKAHPTLTNLSMDLGFKQMFVSP